MRSVSTALRQGELCEGDTMDEPTTQEVDNEDELSEENEENDSDMYEVEKILKHKNLKVRHIYW